MAKVDSRWIARARQLVEATGGMDKKQRHRFLEAEQRAGRGSPHTCRRQMAALGWLDDNLARYGIDLERVACAYTTVEALAMLERERPDQAASIAADALGARMTSREVIHLASVARERSFAGERPSTWEVFLMDEVGRFLPGGRATIVDEAARMSEAARILKVDIEWVMADDRRFAVFLSPKLKASVGNSFSEVFNAAMLAKRVFALVLFISYDDEEIAFVNRHQALFDGQSVAPLLVSPDRAELLAQLDDL